ncbi:sugar kinases, ribokinase family [Candidatus Scalindua japonica]|uniref:Sugar kinases, ribokinase family n=1 Tax=Candidatus Scalindua japonica TaxID=1284222 RepID=A0A286TZ20_9BACT|nr:carbohydrate kinase family protein [Candidatus Scalindua japonica]GAX61114.1 sugar kinases, ribokinase family [Candidatus Scalindua japonica]
MNTIVSGSLAYDRIMDFPGKFSDHILPDKVHVLNVCFMINELKENFGGTAGNIAYALSLQGESPTIVATAGRDFESYREWFNKNSISTDNIKVVEEELTAGAYITTDLSDNQITAFNPGAMKFCASYDFQSADHSNTVAIVSPGNLDDMFNFSNIYKQKKVDYIFDPGQSLPAWTKEKLIEMMDGSKIFICNDYELQLTQEKTSMTIEDILEKTEILVQTKSEHGSTVIMKEHGQTKNIDIPAADVNSVKDPTGAGDAYRAGLIKGFFLSDSDIVHAARIGSVSAAYCVEVYGPQNYNYTPDSFNKRFEDAFGEKAF